VLVVYPLCFSLFIFGMVQAVFKLTPVSFEGVERKDSEGEMEENRDSGEVKGSDEEGEEPTLSDLMAILQIQMGQNILGENLSASFVGLRVIQNPCVPKIQLK
uniref:Uncharacterized protein n=1 Tax=Gouania willdenowi TaxID=441366 RepID=A0A8C5DRN7_GOUWI